MVMNKKQFTRYLTSKDNSDLLETLKNKKFYSKSDIKAVREEIEKRKKKGTMRKDAGKKRR